ILYQEVLSVEKTRFIKEKKSGLNKTIYKENFDKTSRQIEHAILIEVLNKIIPLLEDTELHLEICIDGDLDSNKTLANILLQKNIQFHAFENHIMCWFHGCIYLAALQNAEQYFDALSEMETQKMQIEGLINHLQNNHTDCWPDIYWTKDDPEIILQEPTLCNSSNQRIGEFQELLETIFHLPHERLINSDIIMEDEANYPTTLNEHVKIIANKIFKFSELRPGQLDAIKYFIEKEKDTLVILKTGGRKSFCYAAASIIFDGLTIVISPLKSLIQSQINQFVQLGIPCSALLMSSQGTIKYETKIFEEIALGFTHLLYVTPEKLFFNNSVKKLCSCLYNKRKLQFVIDEAHCKNLGMLKNLFSDACIMALTAILSQNDIEALQDNLNITHFEIAKGSDLLCKDLYFSVQECDLAWADQIIDLVKSIDETGCIIIYCAQIKDCSDVSMMLNQKLEEISLDIYNGQLSEKKKLGDPIPEDCSHYDNCIRCLDDNAQKTDVKLEILELIRVVKLLCENNDKPIVPLDI
ncbi:10_t:CDS:2, partial [Gigaspora margarita]